MVRYHNRTKLQHRAVFRHGVALDTVGSQEFCDAIYKRLATQRFFTHHTVHRVTLRQFLTMLACEHEFRKAA